MNYLIDVHTHTLASGHAYNTILEMAKEAKDKELKILGITEHAPAMVGTCGEIYFSNLKIIDRNLFGLELLLGVELNIVDYNGKVDLRKDLIQEMDVTIASLHNICISVGSKVENTNALISAIENPLIDIIGHPDDGKFPLDYKEIVLAAKEYNKLIEINNSSLSPNGFRVNTVENNQKILALCAEYDVKIIVGSDAHFVSYVGAHNYVDEVMEAVDFPSKLIINNELDEFRKYIQKYKKI